MAQCRVGWHLEDEPDLEPDEPTEEQRWLVAFRADVQAQRDAAEKAGRDTGDFDQVLDDIDKQLHALGVRGKAKTGKQKRRARSTKRRQDAAELPRRRIDPRTVGRTFTSPEGKVFRPSMGLTLTLGSYGRVHPDGTPVDPNTTTTGLRLATRFTSRSWWTGSGKTYAASWAMTCSTSPPSNPRNA
jgi:hypothetical protein